MPPFWGETEQQIFQSILKGKLDFDSDPWPLLSQEAKDCVSIMLNMDPKKRATAEEVLRHPWMKENGVASDKPLDNVILSRMRNFSNMNKLKREALKFIATKLSPDEIEGLKQIFKVRVLLLSMCCDRALNISIAQHRRWTLMETVQSPWKRCVQA